MLDADLDLRLIKVFLFTANNRSVKQAAEKLGLSPSAVSQAVRQLENNLGVQLFVRDVRPLRLTGSGRKLYGEGTVLVEAAKTLKQRIGTGEFEMQSLRLGLSESVTATVSPFLLAELSKKVAEITVESHMTDILVQRLREDKLDVLITPNPILDDDRWYRKEIYRENFLVITTDFEGSALTLEDLEKLSKTRPYVSYGAHSWDKVVTNRYLRSINISPMETIIVPSSYTITGLVEELGGWALLTPTNALSGKTFMNNIKWFPLPRNKQLIRSTWAVGEKVLRVKQVELISRIMQRVFEEKFKPRVSFVAPEFFDYIKFV